jgi:NAD-dependent DNA ligase
MEVDLPAVNAVPITVEFCASGTISGFTRERLKRIQGLALKPTLTKKCVFLVIGSTNMGFNKIEKANGLNIPVVGEAFINAWVGAERGQIAVVAQHSCACHFSR